ncbi:MAG: hypothetical protein AABZ44_01565 [Elusimicrobiota bacterium]
MRYWIYLQGRVLGPLDAATIKDHPDFNPNALVCPEDQAGTDPGDWRPAAEISELGGDVGRTADVPEAVGTAPSHEDRETVVMSKKQVPVGELFELYQQQYDHQVKTILDKLEQLERSVAEVRMIAEKSATSKASKEQLEDLAGKLIMVEKVLPQMESQIKNQTESLEERLVQLDKVRAENFVEAKSAIGREHAAIEALKDVFLKQLRGAPAVEAPKVKDAGVQAGVAVPVVAKVSEPVSMAQPVKTTIAPAIKPLTAFKPATVVAAKALRKKTPVLLYLFYGVTGIVAIVGGLWLYSWYNASPLDKPPAPGDPAVTQWDAIDNCMVEED